MTQEERSIWLEQRRLGIGGSAIATLLGLNQYQTKMDLYRSIVDGVETPDNSAMKRGRELEDLVAKKFAEETGYQVFVPAQNLYIHKDKSYIRGSFDRFYVDELGDCLLEIKTTKQVFDDCPYSYYCQLQYYLEISGLNRGAIAVLNIDTWSLKIYYYEKNDEVIKLMTDAADDFWLNHIVPQIPPEPQSLEDIKYLYPRSTDTTIEADDSILEKWARIKVLESDAKLFENQLKPLTAEIEELKKELKIYAKDAQAVSHADKVLFTYKTDNSEKFDSKSFEKDNPDLYRQYLLPSTTRRFLIK